MENLNGKKIGPLTVVRLKAPSNAKLRTPIWTVVCGNGHQSDRRGSVLRAALQKKQQVICLDCRQGKPAIEPDPKPIGEIGKRSDEKSRKRSWSIVTFAELDAWRESVGLSRYGLAQQLGVTNSTWHNWQSGRAVAEARHQRAAKKLMEDTKAPDAAACLEAMASKPGLKWQVTNWWLDRPPSDPGELPKSHHYYWYSMRQGAAEALARRREAAPAAASIVETYLKTSKAQLSVDELGVFVDKVVRALLA